MLHGLRATTCVALALPATLAPMLTVIPPTFPLIVSTSPVCIPARKSMPGPRTASTIASAPILRALSDSPLGQGSPNPQVPPGPDQWIRDLGALPPDVSAGERWMYDTLLFRLFSRDAVSLRPLPDAGSA